MTTEIDFELCDIMQQITFNGDGIAINDEKIMEENIIEILKREKLWKKNYIIVFPVGASSYLDVGNTEDDPSTYEYGFEIFSDMNTVVASGSVSGSLMVFRAEDKDHSEGFKDEIESVEVIDMNMAILEHSKGFLSKGKCTRCGKPVSGHFPIKHLLAVLCEDCNREWERYFSERFEREHGTLLGFHTPIEAETRAMWFKEFLHKKERVSFT